MKRLAWMLSSLIVLAACDRGQEETVVVTVEGPAEEAVLGSGIDPAGMDANVRPQDDLYRHVNGTWLENTEIPADRSNYGAFVQLIDEAEENVRDIIEKAAANQHPKGSDEQKVGDFYRSFMNEELIEQKGLEPLQAVIARIDAIENVDDVVRYIAYAQTIGLPDPFVFFVNQDLENSDAYAGYMHQTGLGLPNREYYFDEEFEEVRGKYVDYIENLLTLANVDDPRAKAEMIMGLETQLAEAHWDKVRNRDPNQTYNAFTIEEANAATPGFDWAEFLDAASIPVQEKIILRQPSYFEGMSKLLVEVPLEDWKTYLNYKLLNGAAPYLPRAYVDLNFDFFGKTLRGTEEIRPRWKRAVNNADAIMGEMIGRVYVSEYFKPEAKARMDELIENLREAFRLSIDDLEWMSDETKVQAQEKLAKFTPKIGYPDEWRDYSALEIAPDDLIGNMERGAEFEHRRNVNKLGNPIDRGEWFMTPQTVNAYYNPPMNEIVFPAAILQPPFFNVEADDAVNYGAIGAVIGHEFSHGFDDQGRKFDGDGNLRDWWTEEDAEKFQTRAADLIAQYDAYNPIDDMHVNGEFTLGENIGDLAGLTMAYRAYQLSLNGQEAPVIDGYTGDQRFFMGWAQVWRRKYREDELRRRLKVDPHSPSEYRANGTVANISDFQDAFATEPGDDMYKAPEERVEIW